MLNLEYVKTTFAFDRKELKSKIDKAIDLGFIIKVKQISEKSQMFASLGPTCRNNAQFEIRLYNLIEDQEGET